MSIRSSLEIVGLTQNEIDIYLHLLKHGCSNGPRLITELTIDKSSAYRALSLLEQRRLITKQGEARNQKFVPLPSNKLLDLAHNKQQEITEVQRDITSFIEDLDKFSRENFKSQNIRIYEGETAYYAMMEEILKGKVDIFRNLSRSSRRYKPDFSEKQYHDFQKKFVPRRVAKGIKIRILYDITAEPDYLDVSNPKTLKEARQFPGSLDIDCSLNTFGYRTAFMSEKGRRFWGIIIEDRLITNLMNNLFDTIWNLSKEITN